MPLPSLWSILKAKRCQPSCLDVQTAPQEKQKKDLDAFQRREQQLAEVYYKNKPLCALVSAFGRLKALEEKKRQGI